MVYLIVGLVLGFVFLAGFFFMPLIGVLFGALIAGMAARGALKGLIAGVAAGAIVGLVIHMLMRSADGGLVLQFSGAPSIPATTYLGWVAPYLADISWFADLSQWHAAILVCGVLGAVGGIIGGAIRRE